MSGALLALLLALPARAEVFIVRHGEKEHPKKEQALLSKKGRARARELARVLSGVPLKAVYCTEYRRTRQTAEPSARAHGLAVTQGSSEDMKGLAAALRARGDQDVLVVGHTDTIPDLIKELGIAEPVSIADDEFDSLFIVSSSSPSARLHRLRYGK